MERFIGTDTASVELFFNILSYGIEAFAIPWDQLLYPCVVESASRNANHCVTFISYLGSLANFYCLNIGDL